MEVVPKASAKTIGIVRKLARPTKHLKAQGPASILQTFYTDYNHLYTDFSFFNLYLAFNIPSFTSKYINLKKTRNGRYKNEQKKNHKCDSLKH